MDKNASPIKFVRIGCVAAVAGAAVLLLQLMLDLLGPWAQTGQELIISGIEDGQMASLAGGSLLVLTVITGSMLVSFGLPFLALKKVLVARGIV